MKEMVEIRNFVSFVEIPDYWEIIHTLRFKVNPSPKMSDFKLGKSLFSTTTLPTPSLSYILREALNKDAHLRPKQEMTKFQISSLISKNKN
jgi:hypothetical protein